jgi:lipopolysaccharide/colanic/teichoic acid biosynthesis glycosyltransferase
MCPEPHPSSPVETATTPAKPSRPRALGFRYLYVIDAVSLFVLMHLLIALRFGTEWPTYDYLYYLAGFSMATVMHMVVYYFGGMYEYEQRLGWPPWLPRATVLTGVAVLINATLALATDRYLMPRGNLLALFFAAAALVSFNRWFARRVRSRRFGRPRVLLVGSPDEIRLAESHLGDTGNRAQVAGTETDPTDLFGSVQRTDATDVLLLSEIPLTRIYPSPLDRLEQRSVGIYRRVHPADTLLGLQRSREIAGAPFIALRTHAVPQYRLRLKRLIDLTLLLLASPLIVLVVTGAAAYTRIRVGSGILYRQERVGYLSSEFTLVKFRTMSEDAEAQTGATLASNDDPRVVRGMRWFRAARLDELPQLWNVIRGEMSLVGPRPERPEFVKRFAKEYPGYLRRHDTPPGLTGLAQVRGAYQTNPGYKLGHDLQYIVNWSPVLDLIILAETFRVVLWKPSR